MTQDDVEEIKRENCYAFLEIRCVQLANYLGCTDVDDVPIPSC